MADTAVITGGTSHQAGNGHTNGDVSMDGPVKTPEDEVPQPDLKKQKLNNGIHNDSTDVKPPASADSNGSTTAPASDNTSTTAEITKKLEQAKSQLQRLNEWHIIAEQELQYLQSMLQTNNDNGLNNSSDAMQVDDSGTPQSQQPVMYIEYDRPYAQPLVDALKEPEPVFVPPREPVSRLDAVVKPAVSVLTCEPFDMNLAKLEARRKQVSEHIKQFQSSAGRQLLRSAEPARNKTHWDYVLQEAMWMAGDVKLEHRHKVRMCRMVAKAVQQYHQTKQTSAWSAVQHDSAAADKERQQRREHVKQWWKQVVKLVYHKHGQTLPVVEAKRLEYAKQHYAKVRLDAANKGDSSDVTILASNVQSTDSTNITVKQEPETTSSTVLTATASGTTSIVVNDASPGTETKKRKALHIALGEFGFHVDVVEEDDHTAKPELSNPADQAMAEANKLYVSPEHRFNLQLKDKLKLFRLLAQQYKEKRYSVMQDIMPAPLTPPYDEYIVIEQQLIDDKSLMFSTPAEIARMLGPLTRQSLDKYSKPTAYKQTQYGAAGVKIQKDQFNQPSILRIRCIRIGNYKKRGCIPVLPRAKLKQLTSNAPQSAGPQITNGTANNNNPLKVTVAQSSKPVMPPIQPNTSSAVTNAAIIAMKQAAGNGARKSMAPLQVKPQTPRDVAECIRERVALIWTNGEDNLLLSLIGAYGLNWLMISSSLSNITRVSGRMRSARDCYYRHTLLTAARENNRHMPTAQASRMANDAHISALQSIPQQVQQLQASQSNNVQANGKALTGQGAQSGSKKQGQRNSVSNNNIIPSQRNSLSNLPKKDGLRDKQKRNSVGGGASGVPGAGAPASQFNQAAPYNPQSIAPPPREPLGFGGSIFSAIEAGTHRIKRERAYIHHNLRLSMPVANDADGQTKVVNQQHFSHKNSLMDAHQRMALPAQAMGKTLMPHQIIQLRMRRQQQLLQQHQAHQAAKEAARLAAQQQMSMPVDVKATQQQQQMQPQQTGQPTPAQIPTGNPSHAQQQQQRYAAPTGNAGQLQQQQMQPRPPSAAGNQQQRPMPPMPPPQQPGAGPPMQGMPTNAQALGSSHPSPMPHGRTLSGGSQQQQGNMQLPPAAAQIQQQHYNRATPSPTPAIYSNQQQQQQPPANYNNYNNNAPAQPYNSSRAGSTQISPNQYPTNGPQGRTSPIKPSSRGTSAHNGNLSPSTQQSSNLYNQPQGNYGSAPPQSSYQSNQPPANNQQYNHQQQQQSYPPSNAQQGTNYPPNYQQRTTSQSSSYQQPPSTQQQQQYSTRQQHQQQSSQGYGNHQQPSSSQQQYNQPSYSQSPAMSSRSTQPPQYNNAPYNNSQQQAPLQAQQRGGNPPYNVDSRASPSVDPHHNVSASSNAPPDPVNEKRLEQITAYILNKWPTEQPRVDQVMMRHDVPAVKKLEWFQKLLNAKQQQSQAAPQQQQHAPGPHQQMNSNMPQNNYNMQHSLVGK